MTSGIVKGVLSAGLGLMGSDETIKHDIEPLENALATLRQLKPVSF